MTPYKMPASPICNRRQSAGHNGQHKWGGHGIPVESGVDECVGKLCSSTVSFVLAAAFFVIPRF